ncbi:MAG: alpha/beta hydrolase [Nannocystaceae bacterium]|nr:alpha/beta hydrolase [Nannocystaceae bacterium]
MTARARATDDRSRLVELGSAGAPLRVFVSDTGPADDPRPRLLLHELLLCGHEFARMLGPAAAGEGADRRELVLDLPGAGESDRPRPEAVRDYELSWLAECVAQTLDALGVERLDVVGHGVGALVGMALAVLRPQQVGALVAIAPPLGPLQLPHELRLASLPAVGEAAFATVYRAADLRRTLAGWRAVPSSLGELAPALYWDRLARDGGLAAARALLLQLERAPALAAAYAPLSCPTLLVWGDRDAAITAADRQGWTAALPRASTVVIEGCGHAIPEEQPRALAAAIDGFLGEGTR